MDHIAKALLFGSKSAAYAGGVASTDYVVITGVPLSNSTVNIAHPAPGYAGSLHIYLAGTASLVGYFFNVDGIGGPQSSGQSALFTYPCRGDESGFSLTQTNFDTVPPGGTATLAIVGGANNGKGVSVGSAQASGGWGGAGVPSNKTGNSTLDTASLVAQGASRSYDAVISYSDATSYSPDNSPSYGIATANTYTVAGLTLTLRGGTANSGGGISYNGSNYGYATYRTPASVTASNTLTRLASAQGVAILVFKNDF